MRHLTSIIFALLLLAAARSAAADDCASLSVALSAAENRFEAIRGAPLPDNRWRSRVSLGAYATCHVVLGRQASFECDTPIQPDAAAAAAVLDAQERFLAACLGSTFRRTPSLMAGMANFLATERPVAVSLMPTRALEFQSGTAASPSIAETHGVRMWISLLTPQVGTPPGTSIPSPAVASLPAPPIFGDVCPTLKRVIEGAGAGFAALRARADGQDSWRTRVEHSGAERCSIERLSASQLWYHTCRFGPYAGPDDAAAAIEALANQVAACLGDEWARSRRRSSTTNTVTQEFTHPAHEAEVEIRATSWRDSWNVRLDVNLRER